MARLNKIIRDFKSKQLLNMPLYSDPMKINLIKPQVEAFEYIRDSLDQSSNTYSESQDLKDLRIMQLENQVLELKANFKRNSVKIKEEYRRKSLTPEHLSSSVISSLQISNSSIYRFQDIEEFTKFKTRLFEFRNSTNESERKSIELEKDFINLKLQVNRNKEKFLTLKELIISFESIQQSLNDLNDKLVKISLSGCSKSTNDLLDKVKNSILKFENFEALKLNNPNKSDDIDKYNSMLYSYYMVVQTLLTINNEHSKLLYSILYQFKGSDTLNEVSSL
jgi:hypothetical protein